ncbi:DNA alkylation repair protein [Tahibacter sp. UC22_41]|uniref:DNA alkylation repair protein n=1 Tax=Tahibacter sp. UC22_41 TaxID=3350178 RepID=UPI0036DB419B
MATVVRRAQAAPKVSADRSDTAVRCKEAIAALQARASAATRAGMTRFAIPNDKALGVGMRDIQSLAKSLGRDHALADALWRSDVYEARMLACYVADPAKLDMAQMERWVADIDNWAHCDTACFALFDRSPLAWQQVDRWATRREEFVKRSAFALLASLGLHGRGNTDAPFLHGLTLIEAAAGDDRNFVKKAVNWALRSLGRRNASLHAAAVAVAQRLAAATAATPRWIGKDALRELTSAAVIARLAAKAAKTETAKAKVAAKGRGADTASAKAKARKADTVKPAAKTTATKTARHPAGSTAATKKAAAARTTATKTAATKTAAKQTAAKPIAAKKGGAKKTAVTRASSARSGATKPATK